MSIKAMKQALEALEAALSDDRPYIERSKAALDMLRQAIAEAEQKKPVAWMRSDKGHIDFHSHPQYLPLYTAPSARKPLTEPELHAIEPTWPSTWNYDDVLAFARAIERAHGII